MQQSSIVLESKIDYDNVGESTGVDMHAHEVVRHEMVLPMDQNGSFLVNGKVVDFGQHRFNQGERLTKLTASDVHNQVKSASEVAVHGWIAWKNPTVNGMIVRGLLKHESSCVRESSCVGMQEHIPMCIVSVDGKCYDSLLSETEEAISISPRFARSRCSGRYSCMNGTTISQQPLEMAKVRGLSLVQTEERHSSATNQVRVKDNKRQVRNVGQVVTILDWMVPGICSRCVAMMLDLQGIHEDCSGMSISSEMGQRSVHLEAASKINDRKVSRKSIKIMDKAMKWLQTQNDKDGLGAMKVCASKYHEYLVTSRDYSRKGKCHVIIRNYLNESFDETVEKHGEVCKESHLMDYLSIG